MSDPPRPPDQSPDPPGPSVVPAIDVLRDFAALLPHLEARPFRLGGLQGFSGNYRLIDVDDAENAVIVAREGDGQRLGFGIADFLDAYRRGYNHAPDRSSR